MRRSEDEYELGAEVTERAAARGGKNSAVLSVRLHVEDLHRLETASAVTGRSVAQIVREAISAYVAYVNSSAVHVTVSWHSGDVTIGSGAERAVGIGVASRTEVAAGAETVSA
jgi:predicted DNA-binding protein